MYLEIKGLCFSYEDRQILKSLHFEADRGEITGLIGANGAGKTTTLCNIIKKLTPQSGEILIKGRSLKKMTAEEAGISYMPDKPVYYEELTLAEHLYFAQALYSREKKEVKQLIERLELRGHENKLPCMLSKGTLQKLMIGLSLLRRFELYLADEPFTGLDPRQISVYKEILRELKEKGKAVLISTHLLPIAGELCDCYVMIHQGETVAQGTKQELTRKCGLGEDSSLEEIYLALIKQREGGETHENLEVADHKQDPGI